MGRDKCKREQLVKDDLSRRSKISAAFLTRHLRNVLNDDGSTTSFDLFPIFTLILSVCPDWTQKSEFSKWYCKLNDTKRTWNEAKERCSVLDSDGVATIASVRSQEENDFVFSLGGGWIGGTDWAEEGVWRWVILNMRA